MTDFTFGGGTVVETKNPLIAELLRSPVQVVAIGLPGFAEELRLAAVPVVQLDWAPPAIADPRVRALLAKLSS
jgi:hypothetical protein